MNDLIGQQIGPYKIEELIGRGGMADVYRAYQTNLGRDVAIKVLKTSLADDPQFVARFGREAMAAGGLRHPNILKIYDAGTFEDRHYIVMDYVAGGTLAQRAARGPMPVDEAANYGIQIADALNYTHSRPRPIFHRDLKPSNILLDEEGRPLLTDFGIAYLVSTEQRLTQTGASMGTPEFMSPEQSEGLPVDGRTDIYGLGVVLYQLVTGRVPFSATTPLATMHQVVYNQPPRPRQFNPNVPDWMESIILRAMAKHPADRFATAKEMADALRARQVVTVPSQDATEAAVPAQTLIVPHTPRRATAVAVTPSAAGAVQAAPVASIRRGRRGIWLGVALGAIVIALAGGAYFALPTLSGSSRVGHPAADATATPAPPPTAAAAVAALLAAQPAKVEAAATANPTSAPTAAPATAAPSPTSPAATAAPTATLPPTATTAPTATVPPTTTNTAPPTAVPPTSTPPPPAATQASQIVAPAKPGTVTDFEVLGSWAVGDQKYGTLTQSTSRCTGGRIRRNWPTISRQ